MTSVSSPVGTLPIFDQFIVWSAIAISLFGVWCVVVEALKGSVGVIASMKRVRLDGWQRLAVVGACIWVGGSYAVSDDWEEAHMRALGAIGVLFIPAIVRWVKRGFSDAGR